jgi:hypothetical protein
MMVFPFEMTMITNLAGNRLIPLCQAQVRQMGMKFPEWHEQGEIWCSRL